MANYTVNTAKHATLVANTADLVTLTGSAGWVTVVNRSGGTPAPVYFTVGDDPTAATVEGNNTFVAPDKQSFSVKFDGTATKVSIISAEAVAYSVVVEEGR